MIDHYFETITALLKDVREREAEAIEAAAEQIANATVAGHSFFAFGCSHSGLLVQDIYYRAGTFMLVNPLFGPGMSLSDDFPPTKTSAMERLPGLAEVILDASPAKPDDVLLVVSTSGRNHVPIEMVREAKHRGLTVIALTSKQYSQAVASHDPGGVRVADLADIVIDNHAPRGDAALQLDGVATAFGPVSSVTGIAILHAMMARVVELWVEHGLTPPVYMSGNLDQGPEFNRQMLARHHGAIHYLGS